MNAELTTFEKLAWLQERAVAVTIRIQPQNARGSDGLVSVAAFISAHDTAEPSKGTDTEAWWTARRIGRWPDLRRECTEANRISVVQVWPTPRTFCTAARASLEDAICDAYRMARPNIERSLGELESAP